MHSTFLGRRLAQLVLVIALAMAIATPLGAQVEAAVVPTLAASPTSAPAGSAVVVKGQGFPKSTTVALTWDGSPAGMPVVSTGSKGSFSTNVTVPASALPGAHILGATSKGVVLAATTITVPGAAATPTPATATPSPTNTPLQTPWATPTQTPTQLPTSTATTVPTTVPTSTPTAVATNTPPATATATPTTAATATRTPAVTATSTRTAVPTSTPNTSATPIATATATATSQAPTYAQQVFDLINQQRVANGVAPLARNAALDRAAAQYAQTMIDTNCFAHTCGAVPNFWERVVAAGYTPWTALGENIAAGQPTPQQVVNAWMASTGHRDNILNAVYHDTGVGVAFGGAYGIYWVQEFGAH